MSIHGIRVTLINEVIAGYDSLGNAIYTETETPVDNVLIAPTGTQEVIDNLSLYGKKSVYQIAIPKGDTHTWVDQKVRFFGQTWRVFGDVVEGIEDMIPLGWNAKYNVERYG